MRRRATRLDWLYGRGRRDEEHRKAISGSTFLIDGDTTSRSPREQELVTLSTADAEYVAATLAAKEGDLVMDKPYVMLERKYAHPLTFLPIQRINNTQTRWIGITSFAISRIRQ